MAEASVQLLRMETPVADVVRTNPRVTRVMVHNPPRENPFPGKEVVARWVDDAFEGQCLSYGAHGADLWWQRYGPEVDARPWVDWIVCLNEPALKDPDQIVRTVAFIDRWMDHCAARGKRGLLFNASQGTPEPEAAPQFWGVIKKAKRLGYRWCFHEYWWPRLGDARQETWHYLRFPRFFAALEAYCRAIGEPYEQIDVEITEYGVDGGVVDAGRIGWRRTGISEEEYLHDLRDYRDRMPWYVRWVHVFGAGHYGKPWDTFDVTPRILQGLADTNPVAAPVAPVAPPPVTPAPDPKLGPAFALDPWVVEHQRPMTVAEFEAYVRALPKPAFEELWLHHTATAPVKWSYQTLLNVRDYYRSLAWYDSAGRKHIGWSGGPHLFIGEEGIWLFNPLTIDGIHAAGHNTNTFGIEMIGTFDAVKPKPATWDQTIAALVALEEVWGITTLRFHREASTKTCPGKLVQKGDVLAAMDAWQRKEEPPYLPEYVERDVWDPLGVVDKTTWWLEEEERQRRTGDVARAEAIRLSLIKWLESRREKLRVA